MDPYAATLVQTLKGLLREHPQSIFDDPEEMKRRFSMDLPFVQAVEEADRRNHNAASAFSEEMSHVKENMRMLKEDLSASFNDE
ncbi:hypothetical protein A2U01_0001178 [Trifolium medium]|uniref:Uncharacterized protein n=1 Tax=Trifolium medium TaxID=97028 RepID=A0A392LZH4_9FABA|nr:hypothetical protein [Trifolium medium]